MPCSGALNDTQRQGRADWAAAGPTALRPTASPARSTAAAAAASHQTLPTFAPQEPSSIEKVAEVDEHIGVAMSGLTADARTLIDHGRVETQQHRFTYNEPMPLESVTQARARARHAVLRWVTLHAPGRLPPSRERVPHRRSLHTAPPSPLPCPAQSLCDLALSFGEDEGSRGMSRPFGVALLVAGWDSDGPQL